MQNASRGRPPGAAAPQSDPSADAPRTVLQASDPTATPAIWGDAFPVAVWRPVLGERPVTVGCEGRGASLHGAHDGRAVRLATLPAGGRILTPAELAQDWLWVEGAHGAVTWTIDEQITLPPVTAVVPTFRRERDALAQVRRFLAMDTVARVVVVDQGGTLEAMPAFRTLQEAHEELHLVSQPNLGGSGGYARGMLEAASDPGAAILLSDDDAVLSAESLRRMVTFQALAARPTILGTPLFSAHRPSRLLTHTEAVRPGFFQWTTADGLRRAADLAGTTPEQWTFLALHEQANYTGWWGTLLPPGTPQALGLPVPLFLKWDDAEYGLRATAHGLDHAVLPGTAVHHPPWTAYRTQMSWTARVLHRNRLAVAAAYGAGRGVIGSSLIHQLKHILAGHLLTAELWESGIDAVSAGPEAWMGQDLRTVRAESTEVLQRWHGEHDAVAPPEATHQAPLPLPRALARAASRMLLPDRTPRVVLEVPATRVHWRTTLGGDVLRITDAAGAVESAMTVRGSAMRHALGRTLRSHAQLARSWDALRERYRAALPQHTTAASWTALFEAASDDTTERI